MMKEVSTILHVLLFACWSQCSGSFSIINNIPTKTKVLQAYSHSYRTPLLTKSKHTTTTTTTTTSCSSSALALALAESTPEENNHGGVGLDDDVDVDDDVDDDSTITTTNDETSATSTDKDNNGPPPNLVDQTTFANAVDTVMDEVAKATGRPRQQEDPTKEYSYAIGKLNVHLPIDVPPGLDLTESAGLVLVTAISEKTAETGIKPLDTITRVSVTNTTFAIETKGKTLEETGGALMGAANHALQNNMTTIELELNRLIKGYYA